MLFSSWLRHGNRSATAARRRIQTSPRRTVTPRRTFVPRLDVLEGRTVPSGLQDGLTIGDPSSLNAALVAADSNPGNDNRAPDLSAFPQLQAPAGNKIAFHAYAEGVQIYRWDGASWVFVAPEATLYADAGHHGVIGTHYAGPTWESVSGSKVVGTRLASATADPTAIPWLLLAAKSSDGPGIFHDVTYIQRVNTVGGKAPTDPGTYVGQEVRVPYTAEYFFYRAGP